MPGLNRNRAMHGFGAKARIGENGDGREGEEEEEIRETMGVRK